MDAQVNSGPVLVVAGWVLFDDDLADTVEIFVDGLPPVRARRGIARPDVAAGVEPEGRSMAAGFMQLVPVRRPTDGTREVVVQVRATGIHGGSWEPPACRVVLGPAPPPAVPVPLPAGPPAPARGTDGRIRVCAITHSLYLGGGELYLHELLVRLAAIGTFDLRVVAPEDGPLRPALEAAGIPVHLVSGYPAEPDRYAARLEELAALLRWWQIDCALVNTLGVHVGARAARAAGVPAVWAVHESFDLDVFAYLNHGPSGFPPGVGSACRSALLEADAVVFESMATQALYERQVPGIPGMLVPYGVDLGAIARYERASSKEERRTEAGIGPDRRVLVCMGVFQDRKSQLALVQAFADLVDARPEAMLVLVGDHPAPYPVTVREAVDALGLGNAVRLVDIDPDCYRWYQIADVLVSASDVESLPRSFLEAMAFGCPILASDVFGVGEIVKDGSTGWLFSANSGVSLLAGLRRALTCPQDELAAMGAACRRAAAGFDGSGYAATYAGLIRRLVPGHGPDAGPVRIPAGLAAGP